MTGLCRYWNPARGYGFIVAEGNSSIVVFHDDVIKDRPGPPALQEGEPVEFDLIQSSRGPRAVSVVRLSGPAGEEKQGCGAS